MTPFDPSSAPDSGPQRPVDPLADPDALLDLAAWLDDPASGDLDAADAPRASGDGIEARLARDAGLRALATSARLTPVTPTDLATPAPADVVARAAALVSVAPTTAVEPDVAGRWIDQARLRGVVRGVRAVVAAAACVAALASGWQLGLGAATPAGRGTAAADPSAIAAVPVDDVPASVVLAAASFGVFDADDDDADGLGFFMLADEPEDAR